VEEVQEMVDVNLMATVWACKFMLPGLLRQKQALGREAVLDKKEVNGELDTWRIRSPCIVNVSSLLASHGGAGASVYAASKAAVVSFSRALAEEYGRLGIRVNTLLPGFIDTDMIYDGVGKTAIPFIYITYHPNNIMKAGEFYIQ